MRWMAREDLQGLYPWPPLGRGDLRFHEVHVSDTSPTPAPTLDVTSLVEGLVKRAATTLDELTAREAQLVKFLDETRGHLLHWRGRAAALTELVQAAAPADSPAPPATAPAPGARPDDRAPPAATPAATSPAST